MCIPFYKKILPVALLLLFSLALFYPAKAQIAETAFNEKRFKTVIITESIITTATMIGIHYLWYKKFPRSRFHLFNDNAEWLSMDKVGHATTAYNVSAFQYNMMRWSGVNNRNAAWVGGLTALGMQTIVEIFDGYSQKWGFSTGDMIANIAGSALFVSQQLAWNDQRAQLKFSFHKTIFAKYNPSELGSNKWQSWIKDYNGQTYWLSVNPRSFMSSNSSFPAWMNVALGYGAEGMIGARTNPGKIGDKTIPDFKRYRQFYLSLDADLKRINPNSTSPQLLLTIPNAIKIPAPTLEFKKDSTIKLHWLYF